MLKEGNRAPQGREYWLVVLPYIAGAMVLAWQHAISFLHPAYQGLAPYLGTDNSYYAARIQEALLGGDPTNGIFSGSGAAHGIQAAGVESFMGVLFGWTGWSGSAVAVLMIIFIAPLVIPLCFLLCRKLDVPSKWAWAGSIIFFILLLSSLRRVIHQSFTLPATMICLLLIFYWWEKPTQARSVALGIVLGLLTYVYFWSWTFLLATLGVLSIVSIVDKQSRKTVKSRIFSLGITLSCAIICATPFVLKMHEARENGTFLETSVRSMLLLTREIESPPRTVLLFSLAVFVSIFVWKSNKRAALFPIAACVWGVFIAMHQNVMHGQLISFSTHYYPYVCLASILVFMVIAGNLRELSITKILAGIICITFLGAQFIDDGGRMGALRWPSSWAFDYQHLAPLIEEIGHDGEKMTIVSDEETALNLTVSTDDDVVFTRYLRHALIPTSEFAERYCLSELPGKDGADSAWVPNFLRELNPAGTKQTERVYKENTVTAQEACVWVHEHPREALEKYNVTHLLWNERARPDWIISTALFRQTKTGSGWSLWEMVKND